MNLNRLNSRQKEAVLFGDGPLLVLAGAGSGKTSTMTYRIAHLIAERKVPATAILGLSFTRKAAEELRERVKDLVTKVSGQKAAQGLTIATFHGLCVRILRQYAGQIGFPNHFTIIDRNDQVDIIRGILKNLKIDDKKFDPDTILFEIGQAKNRFLSHETAERYFLDRKALAGDYAIITANAYVKYQDQLKLQASMDFDDLLFHAVSLVEQNEEVRRELNARFRYILVDEYQDTNPAQSRLLKALTEKTQNICVVGDDDQSIYAWRGADPTHILHFNQHFTGAKTITLDQNYRSTSTILNAANQVISKNRIRHPKSLWSDRGQGEPLEMILCEDDRGEADVVGDEIFRLAKTAVQGNFQQIRPWKDFAILYRSNPQSRLFEEALRMRNIPYKMVGTLSFLDRKEIKDLLSYWRLIVNIQDDASFRRIVNWPTRGIGRTTLENLGAIALQEGSCLFQVLEKICTQPGSYPESFTDKARAALLVFYQLIRGLQEALEKAPVTAEAASLWAKESLSKIGIKQALEEDSEDVVAAAKKWENCDEMASALGQMKESEVRSAKTAFDLLRDFLALMTLEATDDKDEKENNEPRDEVTLMTLHGAKGLEFPVVFLVGMEEGLLPHRRTLEGDGDLSEERRLCYVGITRAKDRLILTRTRNRIRYGKDVPRNPSRFLDEIPSDLMLIRNESKTPDLSTAEKQAEHEGKVKDFLAAIRNQISNR
ncbi:MAG: UvrD-helicase domain-containing protein [Bdellovibrionales bacterium]|nr:UvrD-helicase domain-containing protein [Bdellovibrionales bacterium]